MDAKRALNKIVRECKALGISHNDAAVKAGLNRYYVANILGRLNKDPNANVNRKKLRQFRQYLNGLKPAKAAGVTKAARESIRKYPVMEYADNAVIRTLIDKVYKQARERGVRLTVVAEQIGINPSYFSKLLQRATMTPPWKFNVRTQRTLEAAIQFLENEVRPKVEKKPAKKAEPKVEAKVEQPIMAKPIINVEATKREVLVSIISERVLAMSFDQLLQVAGYVALLRK